MVIADHLARHGIGSLRLNKRGCGQSFGDYNTSTVYDFADDSKAAVSFLKSQQEVTQIGLLGHSEGGIIAPIVASQSNDVDFVDSPCRDGDSWGSTLARSTPAHWPARIRISRRAR